MKRLRLLAEVVLGFLDAGLAPRLDAYPQRSDRAGDEAQFAGGMPRDSRPLEVDRLDLVTESERAELDAVGAECIGLDHVRPRPDVPLVHLGHEVGLRQVQLVE